MEKSYEMYPKCSKAVSMLESKDPELQKLGMTVLLKLRINQKMFNRLKVRIYGSSISAEDKRRLKLSAINKSYQEWMNPSKKE